MKRTALAVAALSAVLYLAPVTSAAPTPFFRDAQTIERPQRQQAPASSLFARLVQLAKKHFGTPTTLTDAPVPPRP